MLVRVMFLQQAKKLSNLHKNDFSFQYKNNSDMISSWKLSSVNDVFSMMMKICLFSLMKVQSWKCLFWPFFCNDFELNIATIYIPFKYSARYSWYIW